MSVLTPELTALAVRLRHSLAAWLMVVCLCSVKRSVKARNQHVLQASAQMLPCSHWPCHCSRSFDLLQCTCTNAHLKSCRCTVAYGPRFLRCLSNHPLFTSLSLMCPSKVRKAP